MLSKEGRGPCVAGSRVSYSGPGQRGSGEPTPRGCSVALEKFPSCASRRSVYSKG